MLATNYMFGVHLGWVDIATTVPLAERAALAAVTVDNEDAWAHTALGSVYFSTRRLDDSLQNLNWRWNSTRTSHWHKGTTPWRCAIAGAGRMPMQRHNALSARAPETLLRQFTMELALTPNSSAKYIKRRLRLPGRHASSRRSHRRLPGMTVAAGMAGQIDDAKGHSGNCAGHNPISRWPGSRAVTLEDRRRSRALS